MLVYDSLDLGCNKYSDVAGIEIELEGRHLPQNFRGKGNGVWGIHNDGSIKDGYEYVLKRPLELRYLQYALDIMSSEMEYCGTVVNKTVRTGVHVHINVQDLSIVELYNFITIYLTLENLLTAHCGSDREGNLFCLRTSDAEYLIKMLISSAISNDIGILKTDDLRYSSMNVCSLFLYGSLEFRAMRSDGDFDLVLNWANTLMSLKHSAKTYGTPLDIINCVNSNGLVEFAKEMLGQQYKTICKGKANVKRMLRIGLEQAQDLAHCTDSWHVLGEKGDRYKPVERLYKPVPDMEGGFIGGPRWGE